MISKQFPLKSFTASRVALPIKGFLCQTRYNLFMNPRKSGNPSLRNHFIINKNSYRSYHYFNDNMKRTMYCGDVGIEHVCKGEMEESKMIRLCGWVEHLRELKQNGLLFIVLRDRKGSMQLVFEDLKTIEEINNLTLESVISVAGFVRERPPDMINNKMKTGRVELVVKKVNLLSKANKLPIQLKNIEEEHVRLKYRYLDLRRPKLVKNLEMRSQALDIIRNYFTNECNFLQIETPTLFKSTPEGAREYLVPTRQKGKFYALTQSPQQYKQLLMVGGVDRYFQIARCYRDELGRMDRQPEFTQIDLEMSFVTQNDIMQIIEQLFCQLWKKCLGLEITTPFVRLPYQTVMEMYGSDKPDRRFGFEFHNLKNLFSETSIPLFKKIIEEGGYIFAFNATKCEDTVSRKQMAQWQNEVKSKKVNITSLKCQKADGEVIQFSGSVGDKLSPEERKQLGDVLNASEGDVIFVATGLDWTNTLNSLGLVRLNCAKIMQQKGILKLKNEYDFLWVVDFPLFERSEESQGGLDLHETKDIAVTSMHHPFTAPHPDDMKLLDSDPLNVRGLHYDIVLNGMEIGGGSIRIHDTNLQRHILQNILNLGADRTQERFSHLLDALSYGCPPHGGIALGFDRLMAILCETTSIRDVIAFPKSNNGNELMTQSPSEIEASQLKDLHLSILSNKS